MKTFSKITLAAAALTLLGIAAASPRGHEAQGHDGKHSEARWKTIGIDVASDARTAVLGGTGRYRGVIGEVQQETLGMNSTGFENFRFTFTIRSPE